MGLSMLRNTLKNGKVHLQACLGGYFQRNWHLYQQPRKKEPPWTWALPAHTMGMKMNKISAKGKLIALEQVHISLLPPNMNARPQLLHPSILHSHQQLSRKLSGLQCGLACIIGQPSSEASSFLEQSLLSPFRLTVGNPHRSKSLQHQNVFC